MTECSYYKYEDFSQQISNLILTRENCILINRGIWQCTIFTSRISGRGNRIGPVCLCASVLARHTSLRLLDALGHFLDAFGRIEMTEDSNSSHSKVTHSFLSLLMENVLMVCVCQSIMAKDFGAKELYSTCRGRCVNAQVFSLKLWNRMLPSILSPFYVVDK